MSDMNIINRRLEIQDKLIGDILCTAFEGGITYWANNVSCKDKEDMQKVGGYKHEYLTKTKLKDAIMYIHESETGEKYPITSIQRSMDSFNKNKKERCKTDYTYT